MYSLHRDLSLIGPRAAEIALTSSQYGSGFGVEEQFGHIGLRQPRRVFIDNSDDVGRLTVQRNLAGPSEGRTPGLAGLQERSSIDVHLLLGQITNDAAGQHALHEEIVLQYHGLAGSGPESLEYPTCRRRPLVPGKALDYCFHVHDTRDPITMSVSPVKRQRRPPIVSDQDYLLFETDRIEPGVEVSGVVDEPVRAGRRPARPPHSDQVGSETPSGIPDVSHDISPQVRAGGIAVEEYHRTACSSIDVGHLRVQDRSASPGMRVER